MEKWVSKSVLTLKQRESIFILCEVLNIWAPEEVRSNIKIKEYGRLRFNGNFLDGFRTTPINSKPEYVFLEYREIIKILESEAKKYVGSNPSISTS